MIFLTHLDIMIGTEYLMELYMKKVFLLISMMSLAMSLTSCGSSDDNRNVLGANPGGQNSHFESIQIRQKYGIEQDADLLRVLEAVEIDLNSSGLYFAGQEDPKERPTCIPERCEKWSHRKLKRKIRRAYRWRDKGKGVPGGIVWKKTVDVCEDITYTLDKDPEGSIDAAAVNTLLKEYYDISALYLNEIDRTDQNCADHEKVQQVQQQIHRVYMKSVTSNPGSVGQSTGRQRIPYAN